MEDQKNSVRVFVICKSEPVRQALLHMFNDVPALELVGITADQFVPPQRLMELNPDLLLVNIEAKEDAGLKMIRQLPHSLRHCKTIVLSKAARSKSLHLMTKENPIAAVLDPDDTSRLKTEIQKLVMEKLAATASGKPLSSSSGKDVHFNYVELLVDKPHQSTFPCSAHNMIERRHHRTGRRQEEIDLAASVARFQSFVEQLPGMPYIRRLDPTGSYLYVGPRILELSGFTQEEWCRDSQLAKQQVHFEDREKIERSYRSALAKNGSYAVDYRIYRKDGALRWWHDEARVMTDHNGQPLFLQGAVLDITERRQAQEELERSHSELQDLVNMLDSLRTEEQKRLAHEMHDDLGQLLAAMKIDLSTLQQHVQRQDEEAVKYLKSINDLVDAMVTSVRRIIANLPPKIIDDLGLLPALKSMIGNFESRYHIKCSLEVSGQELEVDTHIATAVYRMMQEALNNVAKHAHATLVRITVHCTDTLIELSISDNGVGISPDSFHKAGSFGLIGMRERAVALGGHMKIKSSPLGGTSLSISIPTNTVSNTERMKKSSH
jgi:two-component system sensor histidine kinase UhpB